MNDIEKKRPLLIIISRTRNYAWVTRAFLEGNTRWADYVIITDQMSTDGTREMCAEYENVYLVDDHDMEFKENGGFKMAFAKGRELAAGYDAIYFALDIDEVMPANWKKTNDGQKILNSKPGDMFSIAWANVLVGYKLYHDDRMYQDGKYTVWHDNGMEWQDCGLELHAPHLPYTSWDEKPYAVKDFALIHFGWSNPRWNKYKAIYHKILDVHQHRSASPIAIYRTYQEVISQVNKYSEESAELPGVKTMEEEWLFNDFDLFATIDMQTEPIFVGLIKDLIKEDGVGQYRCLDIWDDEMKQLAGIDYDPRTCTWKMAHKYMRLTQPYKNSYCVRAIDKILKKLLPSKRL